MGHFLNCYQLMVKFGWSTYLMRLNIELVNKVLGEQMPLSQSFIGNHPNQLLGDHLQNPLWTYSNEDVMLQDDKAIWHWAHIVPDWFELNSEQFQHNI